MPESHSAETCRPPWYRAPFHENLAALMPALCGWALFWRLVQTWLAACNLEGQLLLLLGGLVAAFLGFRGRLLRLLASIHFAIAQIALLVLVAAAWAFQVWPARLLMPSDPRRSLVLYALLVLLALSTLAVAWKRRPYPLPRVGFLLVHAAPTLLLLGVLWGTLRGTRAFADLKPGQAVSTFVLDAMEPGGPLVLPGFQVRLDAVEARPDFRLLAFLPLKMGGTGRDPEVYEVKEGLHVKLPEASLRLEVEQVLPNAVDMGRFVENPGTAENPVLQVLLGLGLPEPLAGHLFARSPTAFRRDEPEGRFAVLFRESPDAAMLASLGPRPPSSEEVVLTHSNQEILEPAKVGTTWKLGEWRFVVEKSYPDFAIRQDVDGNPEAYSRSRSPRDPWLQVGLRAPDGSLRRILLSARNPETTDRLNAPNLPQGLGLRYMRSGEETQRRFVLFTRSDRAVRLVESGRVIRSEPLTLKKPFVVEEGLSVTPLALLDHPEFVPDFAPDPDPERSKRFEHPAIRVKVLDPDSGVKESRWLDSAAPDGASTSFLGGRLRLAYRQKDPEPADLRSTLALVDAAGRELERKTVSARDPLLFRGYAFRPSDDLRSGSRILLSYEPGRWILFAGFGSLLLGSLWMFFLKPWLKRREASGAAR